MKLIDLLRAEISWHVEAARRAGEAWHVMKPKHSVFRSSHRAGRRQIQTHSTVERASLARLAQIVLLVPSHKPNCYD